MTRSFVLRVDLDARPWRIEDQMFTAMALRLLDAARDEGWRMHAFVSTPTIGLYPALPDAVLNDGHALDWLRLEDSESIATAAEAMLRFGHRPSLEDLGQSSHIADSHWARLNHVTETNWGSALLLGEDDLLVWRVTPQDLGEIDPSLLGVASIVRRLIGSGRRMVTLGETSP